ncbi:unnamed protein product, partial [Ectocarpus sp. 13 AM-2016]
FVYHIFVHSITLVLRRTRSPRGRSIYFYQNRCTFVLGLLAIEIACHAAEAGQASTSRPLLSVVLDVASTQRVKEKCKRFFRITSSKSPPLLSLPLKSKPDHPSCGSRVNILVSRGVQGWSWIGKGCIRCRRGLAPTIVGEHFKGDLWLREPRTSLL